MGGDEESYPVTDMECDYGGDDDDKMSDVSLQTTMNTTGEKRCVLWD